MCKKKIGCLSLFILSIFFMNTALWGGTARAADTGNPEKQAVTDPEGFPDRLAGVKITLPSGYDADENRHYPVLYLMPEDGISAWSKETVEALQETLDSDAAMDMILVQPLFGPAREAEPDVEEDGPAREAEPVAEEDGSAGEAEPDVEEDGSAGEAEPGIAVEEKVTENAMTDASETEMNYSGGSPAQAVDMDVRTAMRELVAWMDESYRTVADPGGRAVGGVADGAYLAALLAYTDPDGKILASPDLFGMVGCVSGNFAGEDNFWLPRYGSVRDMLQHGPLTNGIAMKYYSFVSSASEDPNAYEEDGANDLIAYLITRGAAYAGQYYGYYGNADNTVLDLTIPHGENDAAFRKDAVRRMAEGFTRRMQWRLAEGSLTLSTQAAAAGTDPVEAVCTVRMRPFFSLFYPEGKAEVTVKVSFGEEKPFLESASGNESTLVYDEVSDTLMLTEETWTNEEAPFLLPDRIWAAQGSAVSGDDSAPAEAEADSSAQQDETQIRLTCEFLGAQMELAQVPLVQIRTPGDAPEDRFVELMGEWKFQPQPMVKPGNVPSAEDAADWESTVPCLGWWDERTSKESDMRAFAGYVWYVREFEVPEDFPREEMYQLPLGAFDETDIVFVNGEMVGSTGLDASTWRHLEDTWDRQRVYTVPEEVLSFGGTNVIQVLAHNESGDGGWYTGHPGLYTQAAYEKWFPDSNSDNGSFYSVTIPSACKAKALKTGEETEEESFLIYLPQGYDDPENQEKRYPTAYLFHQLNSTSHSYVLDGVDQLLDEAIAAGELQDVIVVVPDSAPESWWMFGWDDMVTEEILPYVDANYRTIADADHRFTAGASMGGHGAWHIALEHPDLFSGMISYYGAINMGAHPLMKEQEMSAGEISHYTQFFICGNRDLYEFGIPAIELDHLLRENEVPHYFALDEGGHDSATYLPHFVESFAYQMEKMGE